MSELKLSYSLQFEDLYSKNGLAKVDAAFAEHLKSANVELFNKFVAARANRPAEKKDESNLLIELAPSLEDFIAELFNIRAEVTKLQFAHNATGDLYTAKRLFVQRAAAKYSKAADIENFNSDKSLIQIYNNCHPSAGWDLSPDCTTPADHVPLPPRWAALPAPPGRQRCQPALA